MLRPTMLPSYVASGDSCGEIGSASPQTWTCGIRGRAQIAVDRHAAVRLRDIARGEIERVDIGNAAGTVDDAIGLSGVLGTIMNEDDA